MSNRALIVWIVLSALFLALLNLPADVSRRAKAGFRELLAPLQGAVAGASQRTGERLRSLRGLRGLAEENRRLAEDLVRLRLEAQALKALEAENGALRRQLQFQQRTPRRLVLADIIGRDVTGWWQTIRLGKGAADGIGRDMAVLTPEGLIGKTIEVSPHTCDVLLISDPACQVSARLSRSGAFGIVAGRGPSAGAQVVCRMQYLNKNVPLVPGDEVVTSGLGGVFPAGLLVGYIERVETDPSGLFQGADVIPKADLGLLDYVFVVLGPAESPRAEKEGL